MLKDSLQKISKKKIYIPILILILILAGISSFYFWQKGIPKIPRPVYAQGYRLVEEKISQSAAIRIYLPPGISEEEAKGNIRFYPEIKGTWLETKKQTFWENPILYLAQLVNIFPEENIAVFKPEQKLKLNRYYSVELTGFNGAVLKGDFLAVEDPKIVAIFPRENSETNEKSEITILFNRPMVPLTTLGYLEKEEVPVEIIPKTEGRFKWITTRNLQFIPKERLIRSSHYTVKVKSGLISMDGLPVEGQEIKFFTRPLRYLNLNSGQTIYNQPISIYFNQPVDLEKTKKEIELKNLITNQVIKASFEYGKKREEIDQSIIRVYPERDKFGREKLWDFKNSYQLIINRAYPTEGDIILDERRTTSINVTDIIENIWAESERTEWAELNFFDPQGKLWVSFYEEINLENSRISVPKLKEINYGEKCKEETENTKECEKIPDKKRIYITFKSEEIGKNERLEIKFEKIVNFEGLKINPELIINSIISYPEFKILRTVPENNSSGASLTEFIFCSNSPISVPAKEDYQKYLKANLDYEITDWGSSWRVERRYNGEPCQINEFHTNISYGLIPLAEYQLEFKLEDVFGQKLDYSLSFRTGEMPSFKLSFYHLQNRYNVTTPEKTNLTFATENMEYLDLEICKLEPRDLLYYLENKPSYSEKLPTAKCKELIEDKIELPKRYWVKNYFRVNIEDYFKEPLGHYILTLSHPNYRERWGEKRRIYEKSYLSVTNLAVIEKKINPETEVRYLRWKNGGELLGPAELRKLKNLYYILDLRDLEPVLGAKIDLYQNQELNFVNSFQTNFQGIALTDVIYNLRGVIVGKGKDSTVIPSQESKLDWASSAYLAQKIYLYTDKPIYRPSHEVFIKGIYRKGYDGDYWIPKEKINLRVYNSKGDEIFNKDLEINDFGTFNTSLILAKDAPLGSYRICAKESCAYFDVEEYVPAAFEIKLKTDKDEYVSKEIVNLDIEASYYFGVPLEGGEVSYTISSQNYYFDRYQDEYFSFDQRWYYWPPYRYGEKFILRGKTNLNENGQAKITQELDFEKIFKDKEDRKSKIVIFDVTIKNPQGQTVSAQKSFIVHAGKFYLGLKPEKYFLTKNEEFSIKAKSVDTQGKELKVRNIDLNIYKLDWIYSKRQGTDGRYYYHWEEKRELVKNFRFDTDEKGNYIQKLKIAEEGSYLAEISAKDEKGNLVFAEHYFYVSGPRPVSIKPIEDTGLEIEAEKSELEVGEKGKIIIKSPYLKAKALICIERGEIFDYQIRDINQNLYQYEFEVKSDYIPNVFVSVTLISSTAEIKFGKVEFKIGTEEKELKIEAKSNKRYYLPGEEVILDINAKDWEGNPVSAEVSVAVVDLSVLALKGNPKKNPLIFFYAGFPLAVSTASNLKNILIEISPEELEKLEEKGGAGAGMVEELARKKRGIFKETAFWQAVIQTDENGKARVKFTLPDNLTTWQTETLGLTKDTKLGVNYQEFITRKELMVLLLKPRFIVPGDIFYIGGKVFNQSKDDQKISLRFESQTLKLLDDSEKFLTLKPDQTETLYFKVEAPSDYEKGEHLFLLSAKTDGLEDTVEMPISITRNNTYEVTATSNYTSEKESREYIFLPGNIVKDRGELNIKNSATLAVFLSDSLNYLLQFPYGCVEQTASKLNAIAIVKKGLNLPNLADKFELEKIKDREGKEYTIDEVVEIGLAKIYNFQNYDGGFAFWRGGESSFYATLHVVDTLNNLSQAGYQINQNSLSRAADFLYRKITTDYQLYQNKNAVILTAYTLFNLPDFKKDGALREKIVNIVQDDLFINEQISNSSLSYLAILLSKGNFEEDLKNKIFQVLENRIDIDSRGAFLEPNQNFLWYYYETPIKDTALLLKALSADQREIRVLDKVVRWLLNSRAKDGAWGSTNNTSAVIDAFTDFLKWKRETESNFIFNLLINEKKEGNYHFFAETILDQYQREIPLKDLKFNKINEVKFLKENLNNLPNNLYYDLSLKYYLPAEQIPPRDEGFTIERGYYSVDDKENKNPLKEAKVGDVLKVHLKVTVPATRNFVIVEDFIPAGMEIVNLRLETEQKSLLIREEEPEYYDYWYDYDYYYWRYEDRSFRPDFQELHDDRAFLFRENLSPGVYEYEYYVRALIRGKFLHLPAVASEMYFPENFGRTPGGYFEIK